MDLALWGGDGTLRTGGTVPVAVVLVIAVPVFALLTVRARWPRLVFGVVWAYSLLFALAIPFYQPFTGLLIALFHLARHRPLRQSLPALAAVGAPFAVNTFNSITLNHVGAAEGLGIAAFWALLTGVVWELGRTGYRAAETAQLREQNRAAQAALAVQQERLRLARELHDSVANSVSAVIMQAAGARHVAQDVDPALSTVLDSIESSSTQAMRELRRLLGLLHDTGDAPDELAAGASLEDLDQLLDTTRACAVAVRLTEVGDRIRLDRSVDHAAYRVVQESLANAIKHGGRGATAEVTLGWGQDALAITVRSTPGVADAPPSAERRPADLAGSSGLGLPGLAERVGAIGGRLDAGESSGSRFVVSALLPFRPGNPG